MTSMSDGEDIKFELHILVVDDEPGIRNYLRDFLTAKGFKVQVAEDGAKALDLLRRGEIHLALVDLTLPDMNGLDIVRQAKQAVPDLVGVVMSGRPVGSYEELIQHGVDDYITKPFTFEELTHLIDKYEKYIRVLCRSERLEERLREEQEKSSFFFEAGHQLKTPIAVLKEFTHLFREGFGGEMTDKQTQYLEAIDQNIDRLLYLVDNIENLSRVDSGSWTIKMKAEEPGKILSQVTASWRPILQRRDLRLAEDVSDNLPEVLADAAAVEQVLFNLVDNASKYGPAGSTITLRCFQASHSLVRIEVEDQGPGIPEDKRELVFQPFARLPEHESASGLGLGLTVALGLMKRMKGDLWLDDSGKPGNRFCLHLQVAQPSS